MKYADAAMIRDTLRKEAEKMGGQRPLAADIGISQQHLSNVLRGKAEPAGKVLEHLGMERIVIYGRKA